MEENNQCLQPEKPGVAGKLFKAILALAIIAAGVYGAVQIKNSAPEPRKKKSTFKPPLVETVILEQQDQTVYVEAMGEVIPSEELTLKSRVGGEIVYVSPEFTDGGLVKKGEEVLRIDPADYELALRAKEKGVAEARYELDLEMGRQQVAEREWALLRKEFGEDAGDEDLALRRPYLTKAKAELAAARADLEKALLDLERTRIRAPFNAVIRETHVSIGAQAAAQEALADLAATDSFHVMVSVPSDRLSWISIPETQGDSGSSVEIVRAGRASRKGKVIRLMPDLEEKGRLARLLIEVCDPLCLGTENSSVEPLLLGEYVRVKIKGLILENVFSLSREAYRDGGLIWIAVQNQRLDIRKAEPLWMDAESVLLSEGVRSGERLIISDIPAPVQNMTLRLNGNEPQKEDSGKKGRQP